MLDMIMSNDEPTFNPQLGGDIELLAEGMLASEELEIQQDTVSVEALLGTADSLIVASEQHIASLANGGFNSAAAMAIQSVAAASASLIGLKMEMAAGEDFDEDGNRVNANRMAGEALADTAKDLYKRAKAFIMRIVDNLKAFWAKHISTLGRYKKALDKAQAKYADLSGTAKDKKVSANIAAIMKGKKLATAAEIKADAETIKNIAKELSDLAKVLKSDKTDDISFDSSSLKAASDEVKKKAGMREGYARVSMSDILLSGDQVVIGEATFESDKGSRSKYLPGKPDAKVAKGDQDVLSINDVKAYLDAAEEQHDAALAISEAGDTYTKAMKEAITKFKEEDKGDDAEAKKLADKILKKMKDETSFATEMARGLNTHCTSAMIAGYNLAVKSAKKYKTESK